VLSCHQQNILACHAAAEQRCSCYNHKGAAATHTQQTARLACSQAPLSCRPHRVKVIAAPSSNACSRVAPERCHLVTACHHNAPAYTVHHCVQDDAHATRGLLLQNSFKACNALKPLYRNKWCCCCHHCCAVNFVLDTRHTTGMAYACLKIQSVDARYSLRFETAQIISSGRLMLPFMISPCVSR
jgi:hypothetical protein